MRQLRMVPDEESGGDGRIARATRHLSQRISFGGEKARATSALFVGIAQRAR
ncbi:MAG: hypothetical protein AAB308_08665 [Nitrospirota bacterium]